MSEQSELSEVCATLRGVLDRLENRDQPFLLNRANSDPRSDYALNLETEDSFSDVALTNERLSKLVIAEIRRRQLRFKLLDGLCDTKASAFHAPVWDILLDLYAHDLSGRKVCVTSVCFASRVPPTTALRYLQILEEANLIERRNDRSDRRRSYLTLTSKTRDLMRRYFEQSLAGGLLETTR